MQKILLCDQQNLTRTSLQTLVEREKDMVVVGECSRADDALRLCRSEDPDLVMLDAGLAGMGAIELTRRMRRIRATVQVIAVGVQVGGPLVLRLLEAGVDGYVTRCSPFRDLLDAIRCVGRGDRYVSHATAQELALCAASADANPLGRLTPREMSVLLMVSQGQRRQEISNHLSLSPKTVSTYRSRVLKKLGLRSDVDLTRLSIAQGLIDG